MIYMSLLLLLAVHVVLCAGSGSNGDVEKALEETIRGSLSLDFSMHSRDEDLYVLIINQDGYEVCKGMINRQNIDQIRCTFSKDILNRGDNKFDITVYSPKNRVLVLKSSTNFHYDPKSGNAIGEAFTAVKDRVFCRGSKCSNGDAVVVRRDPLKKLFLVSGAMATAGVFLGYVWPLLFDRDGIWRLWAAFFAAPKAAPVMALPAPSSPPPPPDSGFDSAPKPSADRPRPPAPPAPPALRAPTRLSSVLSSAKRNIRSVTATRTGRLAMFLCAVALMHQGPLQSLSEKLRATQVPSRPVVYLPRTNTYRYHRPAAPKVDALPSAALAPVAAPTSQSAPRTLSPATRRAIEKEIRQHDRNNRMRLQERRLAAVLERAKARAQADAARRATAPRSKLLGLSFPRLQLSRFPHFLSHLLIHHVPEVAKHIPEMAKHVTIRNAARLVNDGIKPRLAAIKRLIL